MRLASLALACLALACSSPREDIERALAPSSARYGETRDNVDTLARELMKAHEVTGISLALVDRGEIVWATGWGWADVDKKLRAGPRTIYAVASLTKPITAAAVMQAVEAGELSLDDTLAELLPELDLAGEIESSITLGQLLAHRSGLPSDWFVHELSRDPPPWPAIVEELAGVEPAAPPDHHTLYSNLGYALAGLALAREREAAYETLVVESLLRPAGMRTASFLDGPPPEPVLLPLHDAADSLEFAASYVRSTVRIDPHFRLAPAGGLRASVVDLASFAALLMREGRGSSGEQVLAPATVDRILHPVEPLPLDLDSRFGFGWFHDHGDLDDLGRVVWHAGRTQYQHSRLVMLPDHDLAVALASNSLTSSKALDQLAVETLRSALLEARDVDRPAQPSLRELAVDESWLDTFLIRHGGSYVGGFGLTTLELHEGAACLRARFGDVQLELLGPDGARTPGSAAQELGFVRVEGLELLVGERNDRTRRLAVKLPDAVPPPAVWTTRLGAWTLLERPGEVPSVRELELSLVDGQLVMQLLNLLESPPLPIVEVLLPLDDRRARIAGLARGQGTVVEVRGEGSDERLWWLGREFRRGRG